MLDCSVEKNRTVFLELIQRTHQTYTYSYQQNKCISLYLSSLFILLNLRRDPRPGLLLYHHNLCIPHAQSCRHGAAVEERRPVPSLVIRHSSLCRDAQLHRRGACRAHGRQSARPHHPPPPDRPLVLLVGVGVHLVRLNVLAEVGIIQVATAVPAPASDRQRHND
jgi:hypothetical protein